MLYINLVNSTLSKLRQDTITDLSTDQSTEAYKAQLAVNRAIARVWNYKTWAFRRRTHSLSLSSGTSEYPLPKNVGEIYSLRIDQAPWKVHAVPKHLFDLYVPDPTETGNPRVSVLSDFLGVSNQPSAASAITVVSSSSADTTQSVLIEGTVSGQNDYEVVSLNGTTSVNTSKTFTEITSITKSAETAGRVTCSSNSNSVTNLILGPNELTVRLRKMTFYPEPAQSLTATIHSFSLPPILTHKWQDSQIPDRWAYVVEQWAFALALQPKGKEQLEEQQAQINVAESMLKNDMASEEIISVEEPIVSLKAGDAGDSMDSGIPTGYGRIVS